MAEIAVSFAIDQLLPLLREEVNLLKGIHKEFADIKDELECIQASLKDADKRAAAEGDNSSEGVKIWVKQVIEIAFRIEDIIDEYMIHVAQHPHDSGFVPLLGKFTHLIKSLIPRHRIESEIQDIKSCVREIKERSERYGFHVQNCFERGSRGSENAKWHDPRVAAFYMEEVEVVGFEAPRDRLIDWLVKGRSERTIVSVVGMGGQGKTTLAKIVFDNKEVIGHFDCRVWITVSQSYSVEELLRDMLRKFHNSTSSGKFERDRGSLIDKVRNYLLQKRYLIVFDDIWNMHFWNEIESAIIDNKNGSKIFITTRNMDIVLSCKKSAFVEVHELQPLTKKQSLELFNKKAFRFDFGGCCPEELIDISSTIVEKCKGLPLAIVVIAGCLLSTKNKNAFEWQRFNDNLSLELKKDSNLMGIKEILGFSYNDLPFCLKSCLLYFGIYPEDYEVKSKRLTRQWIAERFVKEERGKTLEEVAEGCLTELIRRSLVQVSSISVDGKAKSCRIHDLVRMMILEKIEDLCFCRHINDEDGQSSLSGRARRLSIATSSNDLISGTESSHLRSLLIFKTKSELPDYFLRRIAKKSRLLKVLDFEDATLFNVPKNLGSLIHLKFLSLRNARMKQSELPKSIGMLHALETLDLRGTDFHEMPKEIGKLKNLRHLLGNRLSLKHLKNGIGGMTSLQTLRNVQVDGNAVVELEKLKKLRKLGLVNVEAKEGRAISSSINEMKHLEKLHIQSNKEDKDEIIDMHLVSSPPMLRNLRLFVKLEKLPEWIPKCENLVELRLMLSQLTDYPRNH